ncbi:MAG TPA: T9SS type A sorting domain-containing protein [Ignavibacteria bacterium]|nr:T9SS type A sorting domain-containing protein [Ignavibacteria bacterium]HMR00653.1 T9SS type A sorting domain-containing protein [Ignavibacteria bacterium]
MKTILVSFLFVLQSVYSFDTLSTAYCPLRIGDKFIYRQNSYWFAGGISGHDSAIYSSEVVDTVSNNGRKYYVFSNFIGLSTSLLRYDTASGKLLKFTGTDTCGGELTYFKLSAIKDEQNGSCSIQNYSCNDTGFVNLFGSSLKFKSFSFGWVQGIGLHSRTVKFAKNYGCYYVNYNSQSPYNNSGYTDVLKGAMLNGIVYGDTSMTFSPLGLQQTSSSIPEKFSLYQNYPNPFNPETKIMFDVPLRSHIRISVYDVLGKEFLVLLNEVLNAGTFEVSWDAENYPSGTYFYRLIADGEIIDTKKMILIK